MRTYIPPEEAPTPSNQKIFSRNKAINKKTPRGHACLDGVLGRHRLMALKEQHCLEDEKKS